MNVLVVAAHPDDEVLGCGGTIARHSAEGDTVNVLIVAEGFTSRMSVRDSNLSASDLNVLRECAYKASDILGVSRLDFLALPDNRLDSMDRLVLIKYIESHLALVKPNRVYFHHSGDVNIDHRLIHEAVVTSCRPIPQQQVRELLSFEVASSTEWQPPGSSIPFQPNWFVNISSYWHLKKKALEVYSTEMRDWPHARSLDSLYHLAHWRGAQVGVDAAEAFCLHRNIL